jgi:hypothetical protein
MASKSTIYDPARPGAPFIATIFDPDGQIVASHGFPSREQASAFLQAFMQEDAGEYGLSLTDQSEEPPVRHDTTVHSDE